MPVTTISPQAVTELPRAQTPLAGEEATIVIQGGKATQAPVSSFGEVATDAAQVATEAAAGANAARDAANDAAASVSTAVTGGLAQIDAATSSAQSAALTAIGQDNASGARGQAITAINSSGAAVTDPGGTIDLAAQAALASLVVQIPIYQSRAAVAAATILATVKSLRTQFCAPNFAAAATQRGGADYVRCSKATIDAAGYPALAYIRSTDRFMPDGTTDATNGGYWLVIAETLTLEMFGAVPDGNPSTGAGTVNDAAMDAALATVVARGGGEIHFLAGCYRFTKYFDIPYTFPGGLTVPIQPNIKFRGEAAHFAGEGATPVSGSILMWTAATSRPGRFVTKGQGLLEITGLTCLSREGTTAGSGVPFIFSTNTTLMVHHNAGITLKSGAQCDDDFVQLGGDTESLGSGDDAPFQGYGTVISDNFFNGIRRGGYCRVYANSCRFERNTFWTRCGSNQSAGSRAAFEVNGRATAGGAALAADNSFVRNLIEIEANYDYAVALSYATNTEVYRNSGYDSQSQLIAQCKFGSTVSATFGVSTQNDGKPFTDDTNTNQTLVLSAEAGTYSNIPSLKAGQSGYPNLFKNTRFTASGSAGTLFQPSAATTAGSTIFAVQRYEGEASGANEVSFRVNYNGSIAFGGANSAGGGNMTNSVTSGASWSNNGRTWSAAGAMKVDAGSSFFDITSAGVRTNDSAGSLIAKLFATAGGGVGIGWDLGAAGDVSLVRRSATCLETNVAFRVGNYTIATLPTPASTIKGAHAFATNGRKSGEGAGVGTGIPVWCDGSNWKTFYDNTTAAA